MACECAICSLKLDFDLDRHLLDEIEAGRCVVFAGAGISTETRAARAISFYEQISQLTDAKGNESFPELIDLFETRPNGRQKLIEQIKERFDYIDGFPDLKQNATRFHRQLSIAPYFNIIITTNWDRYFEEVNRATPFVYDADLALWEGAKRPLIKIHGSIDNLSTIVASTMDYQECENRLAKEPHLIFCTAYQDGLIHCLQRISDRRYAGDFANLHHVRGQISLYQDRVDEYQRQKDYWNSAYFVGYQTGLMFFDFVNTDLDPNKTVAPELLDLPFFYHPKLDRMDKEAFETEVRNHPEVHKASLKQAARFAKKFENSDGIRAQHTPFG